jgi:Ca2+-binding EF-hand superfamily protein
MLTEFQKQKLMKLFSMYDAQNLGVLKLSDFERLAQRLAELRGWKPGTPAYEKNLNQYLLFQWNQIRTAIKQTLNRPKEGHVNLEEWFAYYNIVLNDEASQEEQGRLTEAVFYVVDVDESGNLDKGEWADLFRVYNIPVIYVDETFARIDLDGDGVLSKEEVLSMVQVFLYSNDPKQSGNYMFGPI